MRLFLSINNLFPSGPVSRIRIWKETPVTRNGIKVDLRTIPQIDLARPMCLEKRRIPWWRFRGGGGEPRSRGVESPRNRIGLPTGDPANRGGSRRPGLHREKSLRSLREEEQLVDLESRYTSQYPHSSAASLRVRFGELSSQVTFGSRHANQSATRRRIPHTSPPLKFSHSRVRAENVRLWLAGVCGAIESSKSSWNSEFNLGTRWTDR